MSFFAELKRRNVFKVGVAYAVAAWILLQMIDVVGGILALPAWVPQFMLLLLAVGLVPALIFAWAFEMTPEGVKREKDVDHSQSRAPHTGKKLNSTILFLMALAIAYLLFDKFSGFAQPGSDPFSPQTAGNTTEVSEKRGLTPDDADPNTVEASTKTAITNQSVAVLPFVNMSSDPEQEYFSDGITEEIINALVKIPGLSVPARTSVFGFKGQHGDVRKIGEQLGVAHVLEGSIRSQGDQVRITAQLIKVDDGFHLWSETYDRKLDNIFIVQEEIASAIATVLTGELGLDVVTVPNKTRNMEAYDSYLQGRALLHKRGQDNLNQAVLLFKRSTELDPQFAPAWAAMALTYSTMHLNNELLAEAISTAKHALLLDPENVDALDALGSVYRKSWQWAKAEPYFEQAMAIDPQSSELLEDYAEFLGMVGRFDEFLSVAEKGYAIDPLLAPLVDSYTWALMAHHQFDKVIEVIEQWRISTDPEAAARWWYGPRWKMIPLMASGDNAGTIAMANELGPEYMAPAVRTAIVGLLENPANAQAREVLRMVMNGDNISRFSSDVFMTSMVLLHAGDVDFVIDRIITDSRQYRFGSIEHIWSPIFAQFRQHPRFGEYLEVLNLPEYWDQAGWPDICQRKDDGRIECR
ncbi:MAG TPA: tetratricopeptide repeat protein [Xanthomonadales bacterium]